MTAVHSCIIKSLDIDVVYINKTILALEYIQKNAFICNKDNNSKKCIFCGASEEGYNSESHYHDFFCIFCEIGALIIYLKIIINDFEHDTSKKLLESNKDLYVIIKTCSILEFFYKCYFVNSNIDINDIDRQLFVLVINFFKLKQLIIVKDFKDLV